LVVKSLHRLVELLVERICKCKTVLKSLCSAVLCSGDLNSACEVSGAPVDMMLFLLNADDGLVSFSEQRDAKGVSLTHY